MRATVAVAALAALAACDQPAALRPVPVRKAAPPRRAPPPDPISHAILAREDVGKVAEVRHILIGWRDLGDAYHNHMDLRAAGRSQDEALALVETVLGKLAAGQPFEALIAAYSEDPMRGTRRPYTVTTDGTYVPEFKALALRLRPDEIGVVRTGFGYHIVQRIAPDPAESESLLERPPADDVVWVHTVTLRWRELDLDHPDWHFDVRPRTRTEEQAGALAKVLRDALAGGGNVEDIVSENDEHVSSLPQTRPIVIQPTTELLPGEEKLGLLALRLAVGEAGIVRTSSGFQVVVRVPPPRDPLDSAEVFTRPAQPTVTVHYIVLGWQDAAPETDARGEQRTRADLEKLVKQTLHRLAKGVSFGALMAELSEDSRTAMSDDPITVTRLSDLPLELRQLALRLAVDEVGVVATDVGLYIVKRAN